jgi:hypothetical protein
MLRAGEEGLEKHDLNGSKHGEAVPETPEEEEVRNARNKRAEARAEEIRKNMDADGNPVISEPLSGVITLNVKNKDDLKVVSESLIPDNEEFDFDEIEYVEVQIDTPHA